MKEDIQRIQIFGQRCSGTNFLEKLLLENFSSIEIGNYYGFKHLWNAKLKRPIREGDGIKIIIIVRNPYDWLRSVHREPHHCPQLMARPLDVFIDEPLKAYKSKNWNNHNREIRFSTINEENLIEFFPNFIECRNAKMATFSNLINDYPFIYSINYEDLRDRTESELIKIGESLNLDRKSSFKPVSAYKGSGKDYKAKKYIRISKSSLSRINQSLNWNIENRFGYSLEEKVDGTFLDYYRYKFIIKQWYAENIRSR